MVAGAEIYFTVTSRYFWGYESRIDAGLWAKYRGFESHPLRHTDTETVVASPKGSLNGVWRSTQAGSRGRFAKPLGRVTGAWVRIPSSPPYAGV